MASCAIIATACACRATGSTIWGQRRHALADGLHDDRVGGGQLAQKLQMQRLAVVDEGQEQA